jgi:hypothetical protein
VSVPAGAIARSFQPWFASATDHGYIFKYNLVWPAVLAVTTLLSVTRVALALAALLFLLGSYALALAVLRSRATAAVAAALVVLSPLTIVQSTTLLSYVLFGGLWTLAAAALLRGVPGTERRALVAAGVLGALAFCARPYDAVLTLLPFVLWAVWTLRRDVRTLGAAAAWTLAGAAPVVVAQGAYNTYVTGVPWKLPYSLWSSTDRLGFGYRGLLPSGIPQTYFGARQGVHAVAANLWALRDWAFGGLVLVLLAVLGVYALHRRADALALAAVAVVVPFGYLFFWGLANIALLSKAVDRFGPYYFVPVLVPLAVLGVEGARQVWAWHRWALVALAVVALTTTGIGLGDAVSTALGERDARAQPYDLLAAATDRDRPALVFLPGDYVGTTVLDRYTLSPGPPTNDDVYVVANGNVDLALLDRYPGHVPYRLAGCAFTAQTPLGSHRFPRGTEPSQALVTGRGARLERLTERRAASVTLTVAVLTPDAGGGQIDVTAGRYRATAVLPPTASAPAATVTVRVTANGIAVTGQGVGVTTTTTGPDAPLTVRAVTRPTTAGAPRSSAWTTPFAGGSDGVRYLTPGRTFASTRYPAEAETCRTSGDVVVHAVTGIP